MKSALCLTIALLVSGSAWAQDEDKVVEEAKPADEVVPADEADEAVDEADEAVDEADEAADEADEAVDEADEAVDEADEAVDEADEAVDEADEAVDEVDEAADEVDEAVDEDEDVDEDVADDEADDEDDELRVTLEGYYRTRGYLFSNLFSSQTRNGVQRDARFMEHRLRLRPEISYKDSAKLFFEVDALNGVVWGDNSSFASTSLFAGSPSNTDTEGFHGDSIELNRVWMEFEVPVGLVKVGRQPSNWGMGLLANDGDGFDDTFGENKGGATYDRILFATKPISIIQTILGKPVTDIPLITAFGVDRLVEDPLTEFYGYECEAGLVQGVDPEYDTRCDDDNDGITDMDHGYTDDGRQEQYRDQDWWAAQRDDVMEMVFVVAYNGEDIEYFGGTGDLMIGAYAVNRQQVQTRSNLWIVDAYVNASVHGVLFEGEILHIGGPTRAIALPGAYDPYGEVEDALAKEANILGYVWRLGYEKEDVFKLMFEQGYASGDDNVADQDFTGRPLHPDHNVGLILYEEVIARVTSEGWTESAKGLWSNGGVYNSRYIFPTAHYYPMENTEVLAGFLVAWPDKPDGAFIRCVEGEGCPQSLATHQALGWELDFGVKHRWADHMLFAAEFGYAQVTDRLPLENAGLGHLAPTEDKNTAFFTAQSRIAYEF